MELQSVKFDPAIWNGFAFRDEDIVIATYDKAGTTQFVFQGADNVDVQAISPWLDLRSPPPAEKLARLEAQLHRRLIKTHLPIDALRIRRKPNTATSHGTAATLHGASTII
jgi:aryl sulfotransferase